MKTFLRTTTAIALACSLSLSAVAADKQSPKPPRPVGHMQHIKMNMQSLELTAQQKQKMQTITDEAKQKAQPLVEKMRKIQQELRKETQKGSDYDQAKVKTIAKRQGNIIAQLTTIRASAMHQVNSLLTDGQKAKLKKLKAERKAEWRAQQQPS